MKGEVISAACQRMDTLKGEKCGMVERAFLFLGLSFFLREMRISGDGISKVPSSSNVLWFLAGKGRNGEMTSQIGRPSDCSATPPLTVCGSCSVSMAGSQSSRFLSARSTPTQSLSQLDYVENSCTYSTNVREIF